MPEAREEQFGATLARWDFSEYETYARGRWWYILAAIIAVVLLVYAFATRSFLFAVIVAMLGVVFYLRHTQSPRRLSCSVTDAGILVDSHFYRYDDLREFWVVRNEGMTPMLYLHPNGIHPRFGIPIEQVDPEEVRTAISRFVQESEEREEPAIDAIGRALKL